MSRYLTLSVFALTVLGCSQANSPAQQKASPAQKLIQLDTNSFRISMPSDWTVASVKPALITGPEDERVQLSSFEIQGAGNQEERESVLQEVARNARDAMRGAATNPSLRIVKDLTESRTKRGDLLIELHSSTTDGGTLFSQFAIAGQQTVILATIEAGKAHSQSIDVLRAAVENVEWTTKD